MVDYSKILRLRSLGNDISRIAAAAHVSRYTVREVEKPTDETCIGYPPHQNTRCSRGMGHQNNVIAGCIKGGSLTPEQRLSNSGQVDLN